MSSRYVLVGALLAIILPSSSPESPATCHWGPKWILSSENLVAACNTKYLAAKDKVVAKNKDRPVLSDALNITLYFETLCPDCQEFIIGQLYPTFTSLYSTGIFNIKFVPYGNAEMSWDGTSYKFECQHGEDECLGNLIETCAINKLGSVQKIVPYIYCLERLGSSYGSAEKCAQDLGFDFAAIKSCTQSPEGNRLEADMGKLTESLSPPHKYVPWLTVNEEWSDSAQDEMTSNFRSFVCDNYPGSKPSECSQKHSHSERKSLD